MADENIVNSSDHHFIAFSCKPCSGFGKTKLRDIAKTDWEKFQAELADLMALSKETFERVERSATAKNSDEAAKKLADNIIGAYNSLHPQRCMFPTKLRLRHGRPSKFEKLKPASSFASDK